MIQLDLKKGGHFLELEHRREMRTSQVLPREGDEAAQQRHSRRGG